MIMRIPGNFTGIHKGSSDYHGCRNQRIGGATGYDLYFGENVTKLEDIWINES